MTTPERDPVLEFFQLPVPSCKTIYRILKAHDRLAERGKAIPQPRERPAPRTCWQIDFKDGSLVAGDPEGKHQHVVETLNILDTGTSVLLDAHVRSDFTAETALEALALTLAKYGRPKHITLDRDPRLSWAAQRAVIFRRPCSVLEPVWASRLISVLLITRKKTALSNATTAPLKRSASPWTGLPTREQAKAVTAAFEQHYNFQRPHPRTGLWQPPSPHSLSDPGFVTRVAHYAGSR